MTKRKAPTMKDVAREAGVALGTVSKVINGIPVGDIYKKKVEDAIKLLNYEVNTYARGLKTAKTGLVALIIPDTVNPFFAAFTDCIESVLYRHGLKLLLCCADGIPDKEISYLNLATQNKVDGVIALTYSDIGKYIADDMPIVAFDRYFENRFIPRVGSDNFAGACLAVENLLKFGCKHPVYIRFYSAFPGEADKRRDGYLHTCKKYGLEPDYLDVLLDDEDQMEILKNFLDRHKRPDGSLTFDGVFSHTDYHGYLFMKLLKKEGYRVPEDVQIIGFDGIGRFGHADDLFLSSICQPIQQLAEKCVEIILLEDRSAAPSLTLLPVQYRYGGTTKDYPPCP